MSDEQQYRPAANAIKIIVACSFYLSTNLDGKSFTHTYELPITVQVLACHRGEVSLTFSSMR